jgi:pimeloyl-ACP methyl ester carboxylesterase
VYTVHSTDGTTIAYDREGDGPPLILVVGAFCDRASPRALAALLAREFTVYRYDRRGRGSSGDTAPYVVEREIEDLDAVIREAGGKAFVYGHSSGAVLALEASVRGLAITKLAVYEPPYMVEGNRSRPGPDLADRLRQLVSSGRRGEAAKLFLVEAVAVSPGVMPMIEGGPNWPDMLALAHTLSYDVTIVNPTQSVPADLLAKIEVPTLGVDGGASPDWARQAVVAVAAAIPGARHLTLADQDHGVADDVIAPVLVAFFKGVAP